MPLKKKSEDEELDRARYGILSNPQGPGQQRRRQTLEHERKADVETLERKTGIGAFISLLATNPPLPVELQSIAKYFSQLSLPEQKQYDQLIALYKATAKPAIEQQHHNPCAVAVLAEGGFMSGKTVNGNFTETGPSHHSDHMLLDELVVAQRRDFHKKKVVFYTLNSPCLLVMPESTSYQEPCIAYLKSLLGPVSTANLVLRDIGRPAANVAVLYDLIFDDPDFSLSLPLATRTSAVRVFFSFQACLVQNYPR